MIKKLHHYLFSFSYVSLKYVLINIVYIYIYNICLLVCHSFGAM